MFVRSRRVFRRLTIATACAAGFAAFATPDAAAQAPAGYDSSQFAALRYREIGPMRGGRSVAVAGSQQRPFEYYMGTTGGGVYKTTDGGISWEPVTDKYFGGTIGAIAVAPSNPDIVYVGTGEYPIRGNNSHGDGVYKSTDAGKTWTLIGLENTRQISRVKVHPANPDIVYVGAQGHVWGPNPERGVFKSTDGGKNWRKVLFRNDSTGITDLVMDPSNPDVLYAAFWQVYRRPWTLQSGGRGSGIFKSTDAGETWTELTRNPGLPAGLIGNIGVAVSPVRPSRVWAIIEADSGGVFRSDDAGATWTRINDDRNLRQRAWYYTRIFAGPTDSNEVYVLNVAFHRSRDGGVTYRRIPTPHSDSHDLWIAPDDGQRLIEGNDGGANVSFNGGRSWSEQDFATAQMYHVTTSNDFPYQVCGAQQDNSAICIPSASPGGIGSEDWYIAAGCESGYIAVKPDDPDITFGGCYGGSLEMKDRGTGLERAVHPWPENPMGQSAEDLRFRVQWTFPIVFSPHDPDVLYVGGNVLWKTTNMGQSFTAISPDLTRKDPRTLGPSGGPITRDQTGVETYATIFTAAESPVTKGVIWVGSDDGLVHLTRDGGATWNNVTPKGIGDFTRVSLIDASPHDAGTAYLAANRYQLNDLRPMLFKTADYGRTWTRIDAGIAADEFTRVVREDPVRRGLLYAGTERGIWVSFDDGARWQPFSLNLPPVPVHDLVVKDADLVVGTHGRSFWILDDLSAVRQLTPQVASAPVHLYEPRDAYRLSWGGGGGGGSAAQPVGQNPRDGVVVYYALAQPNREVTLEFLDAAGNVVRTFSSTLDSAGVADSIRARARADSVRAARAARTPEGQEPDEPEAEGGGRRGGGPARVPNKAGLNTFAWNMRHADAVGFTNLIMWSGGLTGPMVVPGQYTVRLTVDGTSQTRRFAILKDPRSPNAQEDVQAQVAFLLEIRDRLSDANNAVRTIRNVRAQVEQRLESAPSARRAAIARVATPVTRQLGAIEEEVYQVRNRSNQDPLNYPIKLNNKIAALAGIVASADYRPTDQSREVFRELTGRLQRQLDALRLVIDRELPKLNAELRKAELPIIEPSTAEIARPEPIADDDL
jgi:photosystem II stability/assembly factor-like uncharacterized protein